MKKQHLPLLWGASRRLDGQKKKFVASKSLQTPSKCYVKTASKSFIFSFWMLQKSQIKRQHQELMKTCGKLWNISKEFFLMKWEEEKLRQTKTILEKRE